MASNTAVCIFVIADGQEHPVKLSNALYGRGLSKSVISRSKATASHGSIRSIPPTKITDHTGTTYSSTSTVSLRWYYDGGTQTFPETFYIADATTTTTTITTTTTDIPWDAILCNAAESPSSGLVPQANTILRAPGGADSQREKERKEREEVNRKKYERERREQADRIREAFASKQARAKHS
ncbi:hypothetical protein G647_02119 [Cladophialophora carrionii CBS 160.54]|uniref:Uncharacterized protein n=1 Tax=Cladophialophora carrionii CBS 160.54 TaxID=1279043 RepID=V9DHC4_9EURO|nr:uncharacterized protein G647_02119 [Cladophialophora carrionii CBS 160.54]ETI25347.1 hypothetical protein G647_02119 [Cladophialophora carrionii CBS 160.54]